MKDSSLCCVKQAVETPSGTSRFRALASRIACWAGSQWAFLLALAFVLGWLLCGPYFHYSDTWQLVVNTATTVVTFLMVFLIQSSQNRDSKAIHLKLDELIRAQQEARNSLIDLENQSDEQISNIEKGFKEITEKEAPPANAGK